LTKYITHTLIFILLTIVNKTSLAQVNIKTDWVGSWIGLPQQNVKNSFTQFRKNVFINELPNAATLSIAVDSKYWLWINETLVVFEGQLKRGPTPNDTYYDEVDIKSFLKQGNNTIAILVWYWGKDGFCHKSSGSSGLLADINIGKNIVSTNEAWKANVHLAYQNTQAPHPNFRLPEHNIRYDARLANEDWIKVNFDDSKWLPAKKLANSNEAPWNKLWKRPIPQWNNSNYKAYNKVEYKGDTIIAHLPYNTSITPYLKVKATAGNTIDIRTDNYYGGSEPNVRSEYITKEGVQEFECIGFSNGHSVIYTIPKGVEVMEVKYRETVYNTKQVGNFNSNDEFLNTLWKKSYTTLHVNLRDGIQDSPDRERAQWWGDVAIVLEEIMYSCDSNAHQAIKKAISNLVEWQKPNGVLFSPIPAGNWDKELPAQMLAAVSKYGIWKYIEHSGDTAMIRYTYPFIKKYMALWQLNKNGLVKHRQGDWDWHDWGNKVDMDVLDNCWYYMALEACCQMADFLNHKMDVKKYQSQMQKIKTAFQKQFWQGNYFASKNYKYKTDDRANGLAVCAGLVNDKQWKKMKPYLDTTFNAGPYLEKYILEAYFKKNDANSGLQRMKNRYAAMVNHPTITTLWEGWEIGSATYGGGTYNHGWTGGPLTLMSAYVAGIQPTSIGYNSYIVKPQLSNLQNINCTTPTVKGDIKVTYKTVDNNYTLQVQTINAKGIIAVPKKEFKNVTITNGESDCKFLQQDAFYWYYQCNKATTLSFLINNKK
jgi:alpha-L-rhamnosidase